MPIDIDKMFEQKNSVDEFARGLVNKQVNKGVVANPEYYQKEKPVDSIEEYAKSLATGVPLKRKEESIFKGNSIDAMVGIKRQVVSPEKELSNMEKESEPAQRVSLSDSYVDNAVAPFTEYMSNVNKKAKEASEMIGYDPEGPAKGLVSSAIGAFSFGVAPVSGAITSLLGDPLRRTGMNEEAVQFTEGLTEGMLPGMGFESVNVKFLKLLGSLGKTFGVGKASVLGEIADALTLMPASQAAKVGGATTAKAAELLRFAAEQAKEGKPIPNRLVANVVDATLPDSSKFGQWWGNFWDILEVPFTSRSKWNPLNLPTTEGRKPLSEIFQPATERMERGLSKVFRLGRARQQLLMKANEELRPVLEVMKPYERLDFQRAIAGDIEPKTEAAKAAVKNWKTRISDFDFSKKYEQHYWEGAKEAFKKMDIPEMDNPGIAPNIEKLLLNIDRGLAGKTKAKDVFGEIHSILQHPDTGNELRSVLVQLSNLSAKTPVELNYVAKSVTRSTTQAWLKALGKVSSEKREGWELVTSEREGHYGKSVGSGLNTYPKLNGKWVPRDVALELQAEQQVSKLSHHVLNKWFMTPWKTEKVILRPAAWVRNTITNMIQNNVTGKHPVHIWDVPLHKQAYQEMVNKGKYYKEFRNMTGTGGTFSANDAVQVGQSMFLHESGGQYVKSNMMERGLAGFDKFVAPARGFYGAQENLFKLTKYINNRKHGMEKWDAAMDAMQATFNYGEVTRATAALRGTMMPFFTWQSKIIPQLAKTAREHPLRIAKWLGMYEGLQMLSLDRLGIHDDEYQYLNSILPEYVKDSQFLMVPFRDSKDRLQLLNLTYMIPGFGDLNQITANPMQQIFASPFFGLAGALSSGRTFNGAPMYFDWEDNTTKIAKGLHYVWQNLMPSWAPYGSDFSRVGKDTNLEGVFGQINRMLQDHPEAPTWYQMMGQEFGFKITAVDEGRMARNRKALDNIHLSELENDFLKQMREASVMGKSDAQIDSIAERFGLLRERLLTPKEASGPTARLLKMRGQ